MRFLVDVLDIFFCSGEGLGEFEAPGGGGGGVGFPGGGGEVLPRRGGDRGAGRVCA